MPATLGLLLSQPALALRLVGAPAGARDAPILWAHSSDLADPTPFLSPGDALLTTGTQYDSDDAAAWAGYVDRIAFAGVPALGFGTEVIRAGTPAALVRACAATNLALFEVPYRTPFIAVARAIATVAADERFARSTWALGAQAAIARAALHPDGLGSTLAELATQLERTVALFDAAGELVRAVPQAASPGLGALGADARKLLATGRRASIQAALSGAGFQLQTLGRQGHLRGVLAVGNPAESDSASAQVVGSVVALIELALEQTHVHTEVTTRLRSAILQALLHGDTALAGALSQELWGPLPTEPVRVALVEVPGDGRPAVAEHLELLAQKHHGAVFFAPHGDQLAVIVDGATEPVITDVSARFAVRAAVSAAAGYSGLADALGQARRTLQSPAGPGGAAVRQYVVDPADRLRELLDTGEARRVAGSALAPLEGPGRGGDLRRSVTVWLAHNGQFESAAAELGVHRHTLRARIAAVETALGRELSSFAARADLWNLLGVAGRPDGQTEQPTR